MTEAKKYTKNQFEAFEDEYTNRVCKECDEEYDHEEEIYECQEEDCDGDVVLESLIEGLTCEICDDEFTMMEQGIHQHKDKRGHYICKHCYKDLPYEEPSDDEDEEMDDDE